MSCAHTNHDTISIVTKQILSRYKIPINMKKVTKNYEISIFTVQLLKMASYYENETDFYVKF